MTNDVDMTLLTGFGGEEHFIDEMLHFFVGRLSDTKQFALRNRVLLLSASNGVPLDVSLGAMPFEERTVERSSRFDVGGGVRLTTCSAEDLVVHKAFAGRDRDWADIAGIAARQGGKLDDALIFEELAPLLELKGDVFAADRLRSLLHRRSGGQ